MQWDLGAITCPCYSHLALDVDLLLLTFVVLADALVLRVDFLLLHDIEVLISLNPNFLSLLLGLLLDELNHLLNLALQLLRHRDTDRILEHRSCLRESFDTPTHVTLIAPLTHSDSGFATN